MTSRAGRLPLLDSLRALTMLAILLAHTFGPSGVHANPTLRPYSARFEFTIAVLMLMSAFLLYRPYARARLDGKPWPSTWLYAWNRFMRVAPPYWVALTITALWVTTAGLGVFTARGIPTYYGFGQIYWSDTLLGGIAIAWFLCILVVFYVFLPLYARLMQRFGGESREGRFRAELWGCAALFALSLGYRAFVEYAGLRDEPALNLLMPNYLDWLAPGMALAVVAVWYRESRLPGPLRVVERFPSLSLAFALLAFWVVSTRIGLDGPYPDPDNHLQYFGEHLLNLAIGLGLFLPFAFGDPRQGLTRRVLSSRVLIPLSVISYGILLYHLAVIEQLKDWSFDPGSGAVSYVVWPIVTLAIAIPFAVLSRLLVERPLQRLHPPGRFAPGRPPPAAEASADPPTTPAAAAAE
jgi:peptidoglycan/LPS O-acetylase OafA/YrhL